MRSFHGAAGAIVVDESVPFHLILTCFGDMSAPLLHNYFDWADGFVARARATGQRVAIIVDLLDSEKIDAVRRHLVADRTDKMRLAGARYDLGTILVHDNVLFRGIFVAVGWLSRSAWKVDAAANLPEAFTAAALLLRQAGLPTPDVSSYRRPPRPPLAQSGRVSP